jgi:hypothetical protein
MNIKVMRNIHLYLGVFFAPLLLFFLISGSWQTFNFSDEHKDTGYKPPAIIKSLSAVHTDQRWVDSDAVPSSVRHPHGLQVHPSVDRLGLFIDGDRDPLFFNMDSPPVGLLFFLDKLK